MPTGVYKRKPITEEHRLNMSKAQKGRKITWADKISKAHIGKKKPWAGKNLEDYNKLPKTVEWREQTRKRMLGQKLTLGLRFTIIPDDLKVTPIQNSIRRSREYRNWRTKIFERDNYTCQFCKIVGGALNADHIKPFAIIFYENNIKTLQNAYDCKELWNMNNARTLCVDCHKTTDSYGKKLKQKAKSL